MHAVAETFPFDATSVPVVVENGPGLLYGWSFVETTGGGSAALDLVDAVAAPGPLIVPITLSQGESTRDPIATPIMVRTGLLVSVTVGTVRGSLWFTPIWRLDDDDIALFGARA